jgi:hypothetical protein
LMPKSPKTQAGANLVFRCFPADYWSD